MSGMDGADRPVCVLWVGESGAVPSSLVRILRDQGLEVVVAREAPQVMVELAGAREGRGGDATVVVVDASGRARVGELLGAIERYHPSVVCWRYEAVEAGEGPRLLPLDASALAAGEGGEGVAMEGVEGEGLPADAAPEARVKGSRQRLRSLVVKVDRRSGDGGGEAASGGAAGSLVSEAELAMLLRPAGDEADGREKGLKGA